MFIQSLFTDQSSSFYLHFLLPQSDGKRLRSELPQQFSSVVELINNVDFTRLLDVLLLEIQNYFPGHECSGDHAEK